jgi:5S rRNA maturation endonuclease (ribonuclease M5)
MVSNPEKKITAPPKKKKGKGSASLVTLRGVVIPVDWDSEGKAIATAISTHHEDEYLIVDEENTIAMNNLINEEVEITGVYKKKGDKKLIKVKTCTRITTESPAHKSSVNNV